MADIRDDHGNPIQLTDEHGKPVQLTDEFGNPMHVKGVATTTVGGEQQQLHRSSSSSSSEDDGQGGRRKKKGMGEKVKDMLGVGGLGAQQHLSPAAAHSAPVSTTAAAATSTTTTTTTTTMPNSGTGWAATEEDLPVLTAPAHHEKHKKGLMEKIKDKLPGRSHKNH